MSKPVQAALIGCGSFARRHATHVCLQGEVPELQFALAVDLDESAARSFADEYDIGRWTTDTNAALADDAIEAAVIVTGPAAHADLSIRAMQSGKYVFCEKPLTATPEDRRKLRDALNHHPGKLTCGYCFRYVDAFAEARRRVTPAALTAAMVLNHERGGRNYLVHNACHAVDAALSWHHGEVVDITAQATAVAGQANPCERFTFQLRFDDGSLASFVCGGGGSGRVLPKWYYKAIGQNGQVVEVQSCRPGWQMLLPGEEGPAVASPYYQGHFEELRQFARNVRDGSEPAFDPEQAMRVDEILTRVAKILELDQ